MPQQKYIITNEKMFCYWEIAFTKWTALRNYLFRIKDDERKGIVGYTAFRGQADSKWPLMPTLERFILGKNIIFPWLMQLEMISVARFESELHLYSDEKIDKQKEALWIPGLALMQHYGAATRLLDVSSSPFVACFFALSDLKNEDGEKCIWMFDLERIDNANRNTLRIPWEDKKDGNIYLYSKYKEMGYSTDLRTDILCNYFPEKPSKRQQAQKAGFIFSSSIEDPLEKVLSKYNDSENPAVTRIIFKSKDLDEYRMALEDLKLMQISFRTIYPDFEGYVKDLLQFQYQNIPKF